MSGTEAQLATQGIGLTLLIADVFVYQAFYRLPSALANYTSIKLKRKRLIGCIAVLIFSIGAALYLRNKFVNEAILATLDPFQQGEYVGQIMGIPIVPALLVIIVSTVKGWRESKSFNAKEST